MSQPHRFILYPFQYSPHNRSLFFLLLPVVKKKKFFNANFSFRDHPPSLSATCFSCTKSTSPRGQTLPSAPLPSSVSIHPSPLTAPIGHLHLHPTFHLSDGTCHKNKINLEQGSKNHYEEPNAAHEPKQWTTHRFGTEMTVPVRDKTRATP